MTRHDINVALGILAVVVVVGLGLGYLVGHLTRPDTTLDPPPPGAQVAFDPAADDAGGLPGYQEVYVNDYAGLLDPAAEDRIRAALIELYDRTGIEMTVLTIESLAAYGHRGSIESFATALFNRWGIGDAARNDGVLVLVALGDRQMRIEIGAGYSAAWDDRMQRVIDRAFLPRFRAGDYQRGIEEGVAATIREITGTDPGAWDEGTLARGWRRIGGLASSAGLWALGLLAVPLGGFALWLRRYLRRRPRPCATCGTLMRRAGERADDAHLDGGQRLEEYLQAVDYDVWHCPSCARIDIRRYPAWFSAHSACPQCGYRTLSTEATVLEAATESSSGRKRLDYSCAHCGHADSEVRTIPRISKSSSSSGSSRSSFGGGSSSGGGASGSW